MKSSIVLDIIKLNKKYTGFPEFRYLVNVKRDPNFWHNPKSLTDQIIKFNQIRNWCIETWGYSNEIHDHIFLCNNSIKESVNIYWVWSDQEYRIYLATEKERNWFNLRWG